MSGIGWEKGVFKFRKELWYFVVVFFYIQTMNL